MSERTLISAREIERVEILVNPHTNHRPLRDHHNYACEKCPETLRKRDLADFKDNPDHALIRVWLNGGKEPTSVGLAVLFDVDMHTVELGSLFVSSVFRGMGFGQILVDALATKFNDDNHLGKYQDVKMIAKVRYGNYGPIPILNRTGFKVDAIRNGKSYWTYDPLSAQATACRLYDAITKHGAVVEDDLFHSLISVHSSVRLR